jgi:DNA-binding NarL/FixJ family response regulator
MKTPSKKQILIVEDHPLYRDALCQLVNKEPDLAVCGQAADSQGALELMRETNPDLVIIDITLGRASGLDLLKNVKSVDGDVPVLVISMHDASLYAERTLMAGARGYLTKNEAPEKIRDAIRQILDGGIAFTGQVTENLLLRMAGGRSRSTVECLSDRELEVFRLIGHGLGTRQIATILNLSVPTINGFRARIKEKLKLSGAPELVFHAVRWTQADNLEPGELA